jgi:hypothetical protein
VSKLTMFGRVLDEMLKNIGDNDEKVWGNWVTPT